VLLNNFKEHGQCDTDWTKLSLLCLS